MSKAIIATASLAVFLSSALPADAADTVTFRGGQGSGLLGSSLPKSWGNDKNVRWAVGIPGGGWSSPVVAKEKVFVTTAVSPNGDSPKGWGEGVQMMGDFFRSKAPNQPFSFEVHCLSSADGSTLWKKQVTSQIPPHKIHPSNSYATESPVTDGERVYAYFAAVGTVAALNLDGEILWSRELGAYKTATDFGTGSALALHDGKVFVQCDNEESSFVCALDAATGKDVWRDDRGRGTSWSSPVVWNNPQRSELIVCGPGNVTSYAPASGEVLWKLTNVGGAFTASPTFDDDRLYIGRSGRNNRGPLIGINVGATGEFTTKDIGDGQVTWVENNAGPGMCSPIVVDGRVYVLSRGILTCHDAATGKKIYKSRMKNSSSVTASLWADGANVFALNEDGTTSAVKVGDEFEVETTSSIDGLFWSTPSATDSSLLIRSADKLYCIGNE